MTLDGFVSEEGSKCQGNLNPIVDAFDFGSLHFWCPWSMTYSFGRALQSSVLTTWAGKKENWDAAQKRLADRCAASSAAAKGEYEGGAGSTESDYVANYVY